MQLWICLRIQKLRTKFLLWYIKIDIKHIREMIPKIQESNVTLDIVNNNLKTMIILITEDDIQTML